MNDQDNTQLLESDLNDVQTMPRNLIVGGAEQEQSNTLDDERTPTGVEQPATVVATRNSPALSNVVVPTRPRRSRKLNPEPSSSRHNEELLKKNADFERQLKDVQKSIDELKNPSRIPSPSGTINMISGGMHLGGQSARGHKAYARQVMTKMQLNPSSLRKYERPTYGFDNQPVPVEGGVGVLKGNQKMAKTCYQDTFKKVEFAVAHKTPSANVSRLSQPGQQTMGISDIDHRPENVEQKADIPTEFAVHKLSMDPVRKPVVQKRPFVGLEKQTKLNPLKCTFAVESVKFLGYVVSKKGIEENPDKVEVVQQTESPKTIKDVQRLTGCLAALHRFIARSAEKCLSPFKALREPKNFQWTDECEQAFGELKQYLASPPLLSKPTEGETLYLYLGVANETVNSILLREQDKH
ncbi:hypothetical protein SLEP1_g23402 [Rubroshorea leprosula]|uniref:Reverse transcriptase/retrotransposon-derived protein RNase H-like domain-containing protein n=1 Tax=Rubroshorea leprosula TaxID=152421 RepID=A0AAV5JN77_9ROSI|nr:hypothetical protein SLEP1_g23402 [Rubroshorea leprosula]